MPKLQPQIDWPVITVGDETLIVRWSFYTQFLLSKRKVDVKNLGVALQTRSAEFLSIAVECFAAAVAENYTTKGQEPPTADQWAIVLSEDAALRAEAFKATWGAVAKVMPVAKTPPTVPASAEEPQQAPN